MKGRDYAPDQAGIPMHLQRVPMSALHAAARNRGL